MEKRLCNKKLWFRSIHPKVPVCSVTCVNASKNVLAISASLLVIRDEPFDLEVLSQTDETILFDFAIPW